MTMNQKIMLTETGDAVVHVNGKDIKGSVELKNGDRILFGTHNFFLLIDPSQALSNELNWEYANNEHNA